MSSSVLKRFGLVVLIYSLAFLVFSLHSHAAPATTKKIAPPVLKKTAAPSKPTAKAPHGFPKYAVINTSMGSFKIELYFARMPRTVANFVHLANGTKKWQDPKTKAFVKRPFFNGLKIFRVEKNLLIQTGDPLNNGTGGPGFTIPDESDPDLLHDRAGVVSMVRAGPNTEGSQFMISLKSAPYFDGHYPVFGMVVSGLDVVKKISTVPVNMLNEHPLKPIIIKSVKIIRVP